MLGVSCVEDWNGRTHYWDAWLRAGLQYGEMPPLGDLEAAKDNTFCSELHQTIVGLKGRS
jgi:hypothetical protein